MKRFFIVSVAVFAFSFSATKAEAAKSNPNQFSCARRCNTASVTEDELNTCLNRCQLETKTVITKTKVIRGEDKYYPLVIKCETEFCPYTGKMACKEACPEGCPKWYSIDKKEDTCTAPACKSEYICPEDFARQVGKIIEPKLKEIDDKLAIIDANLGSGIDIRLIYALLGASALIIVLLLTIIALQLRKKPPPPAGSQPPRR